MSRPDRGDRSPAPYAEVVRTSAYRPTSAWPKTWSCSRLYWTVSGPVEVHGGRMNSSTGGRCAEASKVVQQVKWHADLQHVLSRAASRR